MLEVSCSCIPRPDAPAGVVQRGGPRQILLKFLLVKGNLSDAADETLRVFSMKSTAIFCSLWLLHGVATSVLVFVTSFLSIVTTDFLGVVQINII